MRSFSQGRDIPEEKKFVRTVSHGQHAMPDLAGSPETREKSGAKLVSVSSGEVKRDRHSHSGKCGRPKKGKFLIVKPFPSNSVLGPPLVPSSWVFGIC